jgi:hypothetical protein
MRQTRKKAMTTTTTKKNGYVYVAIGENANRYKVGKTTNPLEQRLKQHRTAAPALTFQRTFETGNPSGLEAVLKNCFEASRIPGTTEWFADLDIAEVERLASAYERHASLDSDVERFKTGRSMPGYISPDDDDRQLMQRLKEARQKQARANFEVAMLENRIKVRCGFHAGITGLVEWISAPRTALDQTALKTGEPAVYERYLKERWQRTFRTE